MAITESELRTALDQLLQVIANLPHAEHGHQNAPGVQLRPLRVGLYFEFEDINAPGEVLTADNFELSKKPPRLAVHKRVTIVDGVVASDWNHKRGLRLGGMSIPAFLKMAGATGLLPPLVAAVASAIPTGGPVSSTQRPQEAAVSLIRSYFEEKLAEYADDAEGC